MRVLFVVLVLSACAEDGMFCTLIGCYSGLTVQLTSQPSAPYRVEAYVSAGSARYVRQCPGTTPCVIFFEAFTPGSASIDIITGPDTVTRQVTPAYVVSRPNGPGCEPECTQATVTVSP